MEECNSKRCNQTIKVGWSFCPKCGRDNRPRSYRPPVIFCNHKFAGSKSFCVVCGEDRHEIKYLSARLRAGKALMYLGSGLVAASVGLKEIAFSGGGFGYQWVNSWYDDSIRLPGNILVRGNDVPSCILVYGAASLFLGLTITIATRSNRASIRQSTPKASQATRTIKDVVLGDRPVANQIVNLDDFFGDNGNEENRDRFEDVAVAGYRHERSSRVDGHESELATSSCQPTIAVI